MSKSLMLEDFSVPIAAPGLGGQGAATSISDTQIEDVRLQSYEDGYKAGWDDSSKDEADTQGRISADFSQNLQELAFSYHEARTHVMSAVEPLLRELVDKVFPQLAQATLGQHVLAEIERLADGAVSKPIEIVTAPENVAALENLLGDNCALPHVVQEEPSLGSGQVYIRFAEREDKIDLDGMIEGLQSAFSAFTQELQKEEING